MLVAVTSVCHHATMYLTAGLVVAVWYGGAHGQYAATSVRVVMLSARRRWSWTAAEHQDTRSSSEASWKLDGSEVLHITRPMPDSADADGKGLCAQGVQQASLRVCAGVLLHQGCITHPYVGKPYPSGAAEQPLDGLVTAAEARSQKT